MTDATQFQLNGDGALRHLLTTEGMSAAILTEILDTAESFLPASHEPPRKVPLLRGSTVATLFFEPSTRTRTTFEVAAKRLSADVIDMQLEYSSKNKGEDDVDTLFTLQAMGVDLFVIRHPENGATANFASHVAPDVAVLNAGDGSNAHPTQALLDAFTIRRHRPDFHNLSVAIVGDVRHSRVAQSNIHALKTLGVPDIRVVAPEGLMLEDPDRLGVTPAYTLADGIRDADVVMGLRIQRERMHHERVPSVDEYHRQFGLTRQTLGGLKPEAIIMHPGPINRGVEIDAETAYGPQSVILEQVRNGIAIRMAVMAIIAGNVKKAASHAADTAG